MRIVRIQGYKKPGVHKDVAARLFKSHRVHRSDQDSIIQGYLEALGTPYALGTWLRYKYGVHQDLATRSFPFNDYICGVHPAGFSGQDLFHRDFCAFNYLRKFSGLKTGVNKKEAALIAFEKGEQECHETNKRILSYLSGHTKAPSEAVIHAAVRKIDKILRDFNVDSFLGQCGWGPGVTNGLRGSDTSAARKFSSETEITAGAFKLFDLVFSLAYPSWWPAIQKTRAEYCFVTTVPKNAKTDRTIAIEPGLNSYIQHGIGRQIRRRLCSAKYDISSVEKNHLGALQGSLDGSLATVDFSMASDTICYETVRLLLPRDWFNILDAARSHKFMLNGEVRLSHKFSTMGNGFNFELESLIFLSLALAVCEVQGVSPHSVAIHGDDVVLPVECYQLFKECGRFLGFTVNDDKSFYQSRFRESCGCYFFGGRDVKPFYLKDPILYVKDLYRSANGIRTVSSSFVLEGCHGSFYNLWRHVISLVPKDIQYFGPRSLGDSVLECPPLPVGTHPHRWEGFLLPAVNEVAKHVEHDSFGLLLSRLCTIGSENEQGDRYNKVPLRGTTVYKVSKVYCVQWDSYGDWIFD